MTLEEFIHSAKGQKLSPLFGNAAVIDRMVAMSREGRPAIKAIDADVAAAVGTLDNVEKQHVGRWVRDVLAQRGMKSVRQLDWRGGKVFSSGMLYEPIASVAPATPAASGIEQARSILAAGRLDPKRSPDTVDDFLRERQSLWSKA
jgi:hypothetical protein